MQKFIVILFVYIGYILPVQSQTNYYVSPTGNNSSTGLTLGDAWETIQYSMDNVPANSVVNIIAGTYTEQVAVNVSGNSDTQRIVFQNYNNGTVILDGTGMSGESMIEIGAVNYVTIQGLEIQNNKHNYSKGIHIYDGSDGITISSCKIHDINFSTDPNATVTFDTNSNPIVAYGALAADAIEDLIIEYCEVFDNITGYSEALTVVGNVDGFEIGYCNVMDNTNIGIDIIGGYGDSTDPATDFARDGRVHHNICYNNVAAYATAGNIYIDGARDLIIENNESYLGQYGIEVGAEEEGAIADNIIVRNNIIYNNESAGLRCGGYDYPSSGKVSNTHFTGNTLSLNNTLGNDTEIVISYAESCSFSNNIINAGSNLLLYHEFTSPSLTSFDYNIWWTPSGIPSDGEFSYYADQYIMGFTNFQTTTGQAIHSLYSDPLLVNTSNTSPDFHLQSSSPCIDAGDPSYTSSGNDFDLDEALRISNSIIDIGTDEYSTVTSSANIITSNTYIEINEDPTSNTLTISGIFTNFTIKIYDSSDVLISDLSSSSSPISYDLTSLSGLHYIEIESSIYPDLNIYKNIND